MEIGYPTDVRHVAHIGFDCDSAHAHSRFDRGMKRQREKEASSVLRNNVERRGNSQPRKHYRCTPLSKPIVNLSRVLISILFILNQISTLLNWMEGSTNTHKLENWGSCTLWFLMKIC
ncbi:hypothetical protein KSP39_PZI002003 [Platanthera zijinensis]|uniref:CRIB domain-containing protein n=1 Tax=Platanthera zijinensis TaxID=2320716 RepID=A0AAP0BZQ6_9ASPA